MSTDIVVNVIKQEDVCVDVLYITEFSVCALYQTEMTIDIDASSFDVITSSFLKIVYHIDMTINNLINYLNERSAKIIIPDVVISVQNKILENVRNNIVVFPNTTIFATPKSTLKASNETIIFPNTELLIYPKQTINVSCKIIIPDVVISGSPRKFGYYYLSDWDNTYFGDIDNLYLSEIETYDIP